MRNWNNGSLLLFLLTYFAFDALLIFLLFDTAVLVPMVISSTAPASATPPSTKALIRAIPVDIVVSWVLEMMALLRPLLRVAPPSPVELLQPLRKAPQIFLVLLAINVVVKLLLVDLSWPRIAHLAAHPEFGILVNLVLVAPRFKVVVLSGEVA